MSGSGPGQKVEERGPPTAVLALGAMADRSAVFALETAARDDADADVKSAAARFSNLLKKGAQ